MIILGIDPGITGALACFIDGRLTTITDMPTFDGRVDGSELTEILEASAADAVFLENSQPMPRNGSIASFKLGLNTGIVIGVVQSLIIPLHRVGAGTWKRWNGLLGKTKDVSLGLARELYPEHKDQLRRQKDHNRAEAVLIGRYGVYHHINQTMTGEEENEQVATVSDLSGNRVDDPTGTAN